MPGVTSSRPATARRGAFDTESPHTEWVPDVTNQNQPAFLPTMTVPVLRQPLGDCRKTVSRTVARRWPTRVVVSTARVSFSAARATTALGCAETTPDVVLAEAGSPATAPAATADRPATASLVLLEVIMTPRLLSLVATPRRRRRALRGCSV